MRRCKTKDAAGACVNSGKLNVRTNERTGASVVDALIGKRNQAAGCETAVTFDAKAAASDAFRLL